MNQIHDTNWLRRLAQTIQPMANNTMATSHNKISLSPLSLTRGMTGLCNK